MNNAKQQELSINIETQAARIMQQMRVIPRRDQPEWIKRTCLDCVRHLVGEDRVIVAFYLGMHVGNLMAADLTSQANAFLAKPQGGA